MMRHHAHPHEHAHPFAECPATAASRRLLVEIAPKVKVRIERQSVTGVIRAGVETRAEEPDKK